MQQANGYKSLQVLFFALLCGQVLFLLICFFMMQQSIFSSARHDLENILMPLLVIIALVCMISSTRIFKTRISKLGSINPLSARFNEYRAASMVKWALLEAPCLFGLVCFLLTSNYLFLLIAVLILLFFSSTVPVKNKVANDMGISTDELDAIS